jgi:GNAT superfamily N-acetyltransferase
MSLVINSDYILIKATQEMAEPISNEVNQAYGTQFNPFLLDTPEQPITRTSKEKIESLIQNPSFQLYVLQNKQNQSIAGTICYIPTTKKTDQGYFGLFSLAKEAQGKGIGEQMIDFVEKKAVDEGKSRMKIDVSGFADKLHTYYQSKGYQKTGKTIPFEKNIHWKLKPEYENDPRSPFIVLKKNL